MLNGIAIRNTGYFDNKNKSVMHCQDMDIGVYLELFVDVFFVKHICGTCNIMKLLL